MPKILKSKLIKMGIFASAFISPLFAYAAPTSYKELIDLFIGYIKLLVPLVGALAVLAFFWGLVKYIYAQGNEQSKTDGKAIMVWGLVAIFFLSSIYGIVALLGSTLLPGFRTSNSGSQNFKIFNSYQTIHQDAVQYNPNDWGSDTNKLTDPKAYDANKVIDRTPCPDGGSC